LNTDAQFQLDNTKKEQEDAFFEKWMKQRESQGISTKKRVLGGKDPSKKKKKTTKKITETEETRTKGT
jgi:hypothetical protein